MKDNKSDQLYLFVKGIYVKMVAFYYLQIELKRLLMARVKRKRVIFSHYARVNNFGDKFNIDLIRFFNAELIYVDSYNKSDMALTGSILGNFRRDYKGVILGSGFISPRYNRQGNKWRVKIIRGPLSAQQCDASGNIVFGDPGILASQIYSSPVESKYKLGIIPHRRDLKFASKLHFENAKIISPEQKPALVAEEIMKCEFIASSSLHGLIFADSFRIPNIHLKFSDKLSGGLHKFDDYYLGMNAEPEHIDYCTSLKEEDIIKKCKLRYSGGYLYNRQEKIKKIINSVIYKENEFSKLKNP